MNKISIEYTEMEQLYSDYLNLENKMNVCIAHMNELSRICKETFIKGEAATFVSDAMSETGYTGLSRVSVKLGNVSMLAGMIRLLIETSSDVLQSLDEKIANQIIGDIVGEYGLSEEEARKAYQTNKDSVRDANGMSDEQIKTISVRANVLDTGSIKHE